MPEVYDPTAGSMFRSRRSRTRKRKIARKPVAGGRAKSNASSSSSSSSQPKRTSRRFLPIHSKKKSSTNDPLEFDSHSDAEPNTSKNEASVASSTEPKNPIQGTKRKQKVSSSSSDGTAPKTTKRQKDDASLKLSRGMATPTNASLMNNRRKHDNLCRYAIAVDTRYLNNEAGKDDQDEFQKKVKSFLQTTFRQRGFSPSIVAWTECCSSNTSSPFKKNTNTSKNSGLSRMHPTAPQMNSSILTKNQKDTSIKIFSKPIANENLHEILFKTNGSPIQTVVSDGHTDSNIETLLPNGLMANTTWNLLGDLVDASLNHDSPKYAAETVKDALKVVIFTSAATIFLDMNPNDHIRGIDAFWDKRKHQFSKSKVQSVDIVVVTGETIIYQNIQDDSVDLPEIHPLYDIREYPSESDPIRREQMVAGGTEGDQRDKGTECAKDCKEKQDEIIKTIQRHLERKVEEHLKTNRSRIQFDSEFAEDCSSIKMSLTSIESTVDFHSLCQKWSRETLYRAIVPKYGQTFPTISFQLPETTDFDACDVTFETYYKNMPFRADSLKARQLCFDLILLSKTNLQAIQLVPFTSIDASMIYGVAIGLRVVHGGDEESEREKTFLVQSLFHQLAKRDCGLLLRSMKGPNIDGLNRRDTIIRTDRNVGLFHSEEESQYFLFMPEFVFSKDGPAAPKTGVLHRIANANHILDETCASDMFKPTNPQQQFELGEQLGPKKDQSNPFSEYCEESLDFLKCSSLNPYRLDGT